MVNAGYRELAEIFTAMKEAVFFFNADHPVPMADPSIAAAHWVPGDVFKELNGQPFNGGFAKVYLERANAEADLAAVWEEVRGHA